MNVAASGLQRRLVPDADYDQTKRDWFVTQKKPAGKSYSRRPTGRRHEENHHQPLPERIRRRRRDAGVVAVDLFVDSLVAMLREKSKSTIGDTYLLDSKGSISRIRTSST
jgi:hypothetical protein